MERRDDYTKSSEGETALGLENDYASLMFFF